MICRQCISLENWAAMSFWEVAAEDEYEKVQPTNGCFKRWQQGCRQCLPERQTAHKAILPANGGNLNPRATR